MSMIKTVPQQLTEIYERYEHWHKTRMPYKKAFEYHRKRYHDGSIQVYQDEQGEVLGYFERYFLWNTCVLYNAWIKKGKRRGKVFKELYKRFFDILPKNTEIIMGEKQKLNGKMQRVLISKWRKNGKHKN